MPLIASMALLIPGHAVAQEIVVDPTHIGVAIENTASSLEEMITMVEEMFMLNDKLDDLYGLAEKVDEVADRFREVGYLVEMTETYNDLLKRTYDYSARIREWAAESGLYGYERELRYMYRCEMNGIRLFNQYVSFFRNLKTSDADKVQETRETLRDIRHELQQIETAMGSISQSRAMAAGMESAMEFFDATNTVHDYVDTYRHLGSPSSAGSAWIRFIRIIEGLLLGFMAVAGMSIIFRGQDAGTLAGSTAMRWFIAAAVAMTVLELLDKVILQ